MAEFGLLGDHCRDKGFLVEACCDGGGHAPSSWEGVSYAPLGQFVQPLLCRSNISGVLRSNVLAFWNT
jgi:hypothetical protein